MEYGIASGRFRSLLSRKRALAMELLDWVAIAKKLATHCTGPETALCIYLTRSQTGSDICVLA